MKRILFFLFIISTISFSQINDFSNYLTKDEEAKIGKKISEIEKKHDIIIYINIGKGIDEDQFKEKTILYNLVSDGKNGLNLELKITQDMDLSDYNDAIDKILTQAGEHLIEKKYEAFLLNLLNDTDKLLTQVKIEEREEKVDEIEGTIFSSFLGWLMVLVIIIISIIVTLKVYRSKVRKRRY